MRVPVVTDLAIDTFEGGAITTPFSWVKNMIFGKFADGRVYATQRPSFNIFEDASDTVTDARGRGVYYWNAVGARYLVNNDTVYKDDYTAPLGATLSAGTDRVYFFEVGVYLVIIDPENNEGWYINSATSTTLTEITSTNFPPKQTPALTLAKGGAVINGTLYVGATNSEIFNSGVEDPTTWGALDFISAELSQDDLVYIGEHNQHVAAFGANTTEFFYDNANATGSPLNVRGDISHNIGTINHDTSWEHGNITFFVALNPAGDMNVMALSNFTPQKISTDDIDTFITSSVIKDGASIVGSGFTSTGRAFYVLTIYTMNTDVVPVTTLVYDSQFGAWMVWDLEHTGIDWVPIVNWTRSTNTRAGEGILSNGDIVTVEDDRTPTDTIEASLYVESGYISNQADYIEETSGSGSEINWEVVTGQNDFGAQNWKTHGDVRVVCKKPTDTLNVSISYADQVNDTYSTARTLDISNMNNKLTRNGRFISRNYKIAGAGGEVVEIEGLEIG